MAVVKTAGVRYKAPKLCYHGRKLGRVHVDARFRRRGCAETIRVRRKAGARRRDCGGLLTMHVRACSDECDRRPGGICINFTILGICQRISVWLRSQRLSDYSRLQTKGSTLGPMPHTRATTCQPKHASGVALQCLRKLGFWRL